MPYKESAYSRTIKHGNVRIVFEIEELNVIVSKTDDEEITEEDDRIYLHINAGNLKVEEFDKERYELEFLQKSNKKDKVLALKENEIWFDIDIKEVSKVLNNDFSFNVIGEQQESISYFISKFEYKIKWLQYYSANDTIITVSESKHVYNQPRIESDIEYSIAEIAKAAELLRKAVRKIDLRTNATLVRLNTDNGYLNPVLLVIADRLGYNLEPIEEELIEEMANKGRRVTHRISLKMG